ncbi:hypothetical protein [Streptomyces katsurahamanus]|uniref:hypothetical protein n=1 Tax=Streptomyces katsurahamanus TaxID=2577098 RepID=UPI002B1FD876|nr:hypothetical protein [Streptomyces katsurahamanus]
MTLEEFRGAQKEAKAVASVLREAHTQLVGLRGRIKAVRDAAVADGMRVSDQGVVAYDTERLTQGERLAYVHDPSYQEGARAKAAEWSHRLGLAVQAVTDADDGIRLALEAAVRDSDYFDGTLNGFNRNPADSPYPSLLEAGRAANMPADREQVPGWWRGLGPVTRGILLRERGDELRAAGIMDPRYEWAAPDGGSGAFGSEESTPGDLWFLARAEAIAAGGDVTGEVGASRNMLHYLGGTGEPLDLDVDRILHDESGFRSQVETLHIAANQEEWRQKALDEFTKAGGDRTVVVPVESQALGQTFQGGEWFHAVGSHQQNVSGMVTVSPGDGDRPKVSLDYQVNVWDRYNWDAGKSTTFPGGVVIPDEDMGRLHKVGVAQEFDMRGSSSAFTHDLNSGAPSSVTPADPGREGTRGDVSRGDEENR